MENLSINEKENEVILKLNSEIYLKKAVLLACEAFGEACFVNLDFQQGNFVVGLSPKSKGIELQELGYEFFNYALGIMQNV